MLHPDYQYTPKLLVALASMVAFGEYDMALGSRILCGGALKGGMPIYKYISNRLLTMAQNLLMGTAFSEFHTGYRAFSREVLLTLPLEENGNNFVFDNQMIVTPHLYRARGYHEIPRYNDDPYANHWFEKRLSSSSTDHA